MEVGGVQIRRPPTSRQPVRQPPTSMPANPLARPPRKSREERRGGEGAVVTVSSIVVVAPPMGGNIEGLLTKEMETE
uniref:Uncharacterized protein n=1 Tax=Oryza glaberrima TaxID=4538 RepID=I1NYR6_ORYGL